MTKSNSEAAWPSYLQPLPREDIFALGVIALNYCQLENILRSLFSGVAHWNEFQTAALFHRLANNIRKDIICELLSVTTIPADVKGLIEQFLAAFGICADNRHLLMHSSCGGVYRDKESGAVGIIFERYSKPGNRLVCYPTLSQLQTIADDMQRLTRFGTIIVTELHNYSIHLLDGHPEGYRPVPGSLRGKCPQPVPLNWQIPDDPKERGPRHPAFQLISQFRVRDR